VLRFGSRNRSNSFVLVCGVSFLLLVGCPQTWVIAASFAEARCSMPSDFDSAYAYALGAVLGGRREDTVIEPWRSWFLDLVDMWWDHVMSCDMLSMCLDICFLSWLWVLLGLLSVMCTACSNSLQLAHICTKDLEGWPGGVGGDTFDFVKSLCDVTRLAEFLGGTAAVLAARSCNGYMVCTTVSLCLDLFFNSAFQHRMH